MTDPLTQHAMFAALRTWLDTTKVKTSNVFHIPIYADYILSKTGISTFDHTPNAVRFVDGPTRAASHPMDTAFQALYRTTPPDVLTALTTAAMEKLITQQRLKCQYDIDKNESTKALFLYGLDPVSSAAIADPDSTHPECWIIMERYRARGTPDKITDTMVSEVKADLKIKKGAIIEEAIILIRRTLSILTTAGRMTPDLALLEVYASIESQSGGKRIVTRYKHDNPGPAKTADGFLDYVKLHWDDRELDPAPHPVLAAAEDPHPGNGRARRANGNAGGGGRVDGGGRGRGAQAHLSPLEYLLTASPQGMQPHFVAPPAAERYEYCFGHGWNKSHPGHRCRALRDDANATQAMKSAALPAPLVASNGIRYLASSEIRPN